VKLDFLVDEVLLFNKIFSKYVLIQGLSSHTLRGSEERFFAVAFFALSEGHFDKFDVNRDKLGQAYRISGLLEGEAPLEEVEERIKIHG